MYGVGFTSVIILIYLIIQQLTASIRSAFLLDDSIQRGMLIVDRWIFDLERSNVIG